MGNIFFKMAWRQFLHNRLYVLLNVLGLTTGIVGMLLAILYWNHERSFDTFHFDTDHLYRITTTLKESDTGDRKINGGTGQVQGPAFKKEVPEIKDYVRILGGDVFGDIRHEQSALRLQMVFADENFFTLFKYPLIAGDARTALHDINAAVITEEIALRFFNTTEVIGKFLYADADPSAERLGNKPLKVSAVIKSLPANSSIQFDILLPMKFLQLSFEDKNWLNAYLGTYVLLDHNANKENVIKKFNKIYTLQAADQILKQGFDPQIEYGLQPITDIHLNSYLGSGAWHEGGTVNESKAIYSNIFLGVACFILLLASVNFINISISSSLRRAKEVGIRKINGGSKTSLFFQFLGESSLICIISFALAIVLSLYLLPFFSRLIDSEISFFSIVHYKFVLSTLILLVSIIFISGLYPAYILSNFNPVEILYNKSKQVGMFSLSRGLVIVQFTLAAILSLGTLVFYYQMDYIRSKDLGFNPDFIVRTNIHGDREIEPLKQLIRNEVKKYPYFESVSFGGEFGNPVETKVGNKIIKSVYQSIDTAYIAAMRLTLKEGRNIASENSHEVVVNETFLKEAGIVNPIGSLININPDYTEDSIPHRIVGIIKDFHFKSLHIPIQPLAMYTLPRHSGGIWLKINSAQSKKALSTFETIYKSIIPGAVYTYDFLTDLNKKDYQREEKWQKIINIATVCSLLICLLGLFGLSHLITKQRIKEIGIRKVLGASLNNIVTLITSDFIKLVLIGMVIAAPIAYSLLNTWLVNFSYRVEISWWLYALVGLSITVIASLTVGIQAFNSAKSNPIAAIRTE